MKHLAIFLCLTVMHILDFIDYAKNIFNKIPFDRESNELLKEYRKRFRKCGLEKCKCKSVNDCVYAMESRVYESYTRTFDNRILD